MTTLDPGFIDACEREALHHIGAIQPYGGLLGGRSGDATIRCASADLDTWLGVGTDRALGQTLRGLLGQIGSRTGAEAGAPPRPEQLDDLDQALAEPPEARRGHAEKLVLVDLVAGARGPLDAILSQTAEAWLLELEPALPTDQQQHALRPVAHALYRMPRTQREWEAHCRLLAEQMQFLSGFERVMVYRFLPDGCGEVIAEVAAPGLAPYLGLRYPASDIPQIARGLYLANRHRQIPDVGALPVPIVAEPGFEPDLSLSDLRAVSPVHIEYLQNMEVTASLSFSVVLNNDLWGLIACHHHEPRPVPLQLRERCADLVQVFTLGVSGHQTNLRLAAVSDSDRDIARLAAGIAELEAGGDQDFHIGDALLALVQADGAVLADTHAGLVATFGRTPDPAELDGLLQWLADEHPEPLYVTDALAAEYAPAASYQRDASGLLAVRIGTYRGAERVERSFVWLRPEQPQTVYWAGDPRKSTLFDAQSQTLSPRSSFAAWLETKTGCAEPWSDTVLLSAKKFRSLLLRQMNADLLRD
ncbi:MAG: GAF domain-containing protein [Thiohalocapsa sp.]|uniref:GAF domain-containing protein n=1 Tax=Thiohalocapsa sp. TaxID=2497641 RepID=UPI0025D0D1F7|nr:GAF domain-containing protein [Thiohalocapsa sp.]MCG6943378.1 GAF domain-containing protein [Thiohalocapsa sp.]